MMAYRATPETSTGFTPNMLCYVMKETNMSVVLIYGSLNSRRQLPKIMSYCSYVEELRNSMVNAYFRMRKCLGDAATRQKMYCDWDTAPHHFKKGD